MFLLLGMAVIFAYSIFNHSYYSDPPVDPARLVFLVAVLGFIITYSIISHLVVVFNLPTSSVFEQKFEEVMSVQRLSESFLEGKTEQQMFEILMESSLATVVADGCWIEKPNTEEISMMLEVTASEIENIKSCLPLAERVGNHDLFIVKSLKDAVKNSRFKFTKFSSVLMLTLNGQKGKLGHLYLVKEVKDGFDDEMIGIVKTYVAQAAVSIENLRLLESALENERYETERETAKEVQKRLLPAGILDTSYFSMVAFCQTSEDMGGDYYDYYDVGNGKFVFVLGDVSGKGTSAAFNLAQMKGVFQGLVQLNLAPVEFMNFANTAISKCLEKSSFVTLTYCLLDIRSNTIDIVRAGHCPTLIYSTGLGESIFYRQKGLGLGILRNKNITAHLENATYNYAEGDVLLLYSDGLSEARNSTGEEYGYDRLKAFLNRHHQMTSLEIQMALINELETFTDYNLSRDDLTFLVVKFQNSETSSVKKP
jgi:serine phosphatase RsbU (regulator of sigma subunit)